MGKKREFRFLRLRCILHCSYLLLDHFNNNFFLTSPYFELYVQSTTVRFKIHLVRPECIALNTGSIQGLFLLYSVVVYFFYQLWTYLFRSLLKRAMPFSCAWLRIVNDRETISCHRGSRGTEFGADQCFRLSQRSYFLMDCFINLFK